MMPRTFGERLQFAIDHSGLTVPQLAGQAGVPLMTLQAELRNQDDRAREFAPADLANLCKVLGVSWAWLVEGVPPPRALANAQRMRISGAGVLSASDLDRVCALLEAIG